VTADQRRQAVRFLIGRKVSERRASELAGIGRSSLHYHAHGRVDDLKLLGRLRLLAARHPRYGYRRLWALLRREGRVVNMKRVRRLCVRHGLSLRQRIGRKRRGPGGSVPRAARHVNHVWTYDFVHDVCENGRKLKMLTVVDEFTRECHKVQVGTRISSRGVIGVLDELFSLHGTPTFIRSDNGPEFVARELKHWLKEQGSATYYIEPGSPWQNGYCESFNGKLRDECLNMEVFHHPDHARAVIELWRRYYNTQRPHSSLRYRTPAEFRASLAKDGGRAADGCMCSPPEDTGPVTALSSGGGESNREAGADVWDVPARACGS
jgi:putative transposase